ncbi:major facilitator superfamily domain-containing protein [Mycena crocata]|nr:major facilitator superfamily domain-containing protein [Mycena crocata]
MTSSLLFVCTTVGFTSGTLLVPHIMNFLGRFYLADSKMSWLPTSPFRIALRKPPPGSTGHSASQARYIVLIFSLCAPISFVMMGSRTVSFAFMAYVVVSFGRSVVTGRWNMFLSKGTSHLGTAFGVWGLGAVASPLVFQLTAAAGLPWANFYFGSLVLAAVSIVFLVITFMPTEREFAMDRQMALEAADPGSKPSPSSITNSGIISNSSSSRTHPTSPSQLRLVASMRHQWTVSLFSLFYCGTETTTQGLIVQYLLAQRSANPNTAGYVTSGFWAGMSASRLLWSYFTPRISFTSRKYIIQSCLRCTGLGLGMQLCIWLINSTVENAVSASLIGVFYGPLFPVCLELANDLLPVEVSMVSMAIMYFFSFFYPRYASILPFITGVVTTKYGMRTWSYITVAQAAILFGAWYLFPTRQPPRRITPA